MKDKKQKGLSDTKLIKKYDIGATIDFKKVIKPILKKNKAK